MNWFNSLSNTNTKAAIVGLVVLMTAVRVLFLPMPVGAEPGWLVPWLTFASALWAGSVYQYRVKTREHTKVAAGIAEADATATPAPPARPGVVTIPRRPPDPRPGMTPMPDEGVDLGALVRELPPAPVPPPDETVPVTVPVMPSPSAPDGLTDAELADAYR